MLTKILIVDDEPFFCEVLREFLQSEGYHVEVATNGEEALSAYRQGLPGTVLLDIRMPGKSGLEVLRELKAFDPDACVIVVTVVHKDEIIKRFRAEGALGYVTKPVNLSSLLTLIKTHGRGDGD